MSNIGSRLIVKYPNTNYFLSGSVVSTKNNKVTILCDKGCTLKLNKNSKHIFGNGTSKKHYKILSAIEATEEVIKRLKPHLGDPVIKNKYVVKDRVVVILDGKLFIATISKVNGKIYTLSWDNPKYPDHDINYEQIVGLGTNKTRTQKIPERLLKEYLVQGAKKSSNTIHNPVEEDEITSDVDEDNEKHEQAEKVKIEEPKLKSPENKRKREARIKELKKELEKTIRFLNTLNEELTALLEEQDEEEKQEAIKEEKQETIKEEVKKKVPKVKKPKQEKLKNKEEDLPEESNDDVDALSDDELDALLSKARGGGTTEEENKVEETVKENIIKNVIKENKVEENATKGNKRKKMSRYNKNKLNSESTSVKEPFKLSDLTKSRSAQIPKVTKEDEDELGDSE